MLIDTHAHINSEKLKDLLPEIINSLESGEVNRIICPSFSVESSKSSLDLSKNTPKVFSALGIHPENAYELNDDFLEFLKNNLKHPKVVAVGEIGLDYHYTQNNKEIQLNALNKQVKLAQEFDLPIIFHIRDAFDDFFDWLKINRQNFSKGVVHCFDGNETIAKKLLDFDLHISFTGLATFKPRQDIRQAIAITPLEKIMVETDCPYLAPEPHRGKINIPEYTYLVAQKIAEIKNLDYKTFATQTTENAYKFFNKMREYDDR